MCAEVSDENRFVLTSGCNNWGHLIVPGKWANSCLMAVKVAHLFFGMNVPYMQLTWLCAYTEMVSAFGPCEWGNLLIISKVAELKNGWSRGVPNIYSALKGNCKNVLSWPINKVEVKVVHQVWSIQHPVWIRRNLSWLLNFFKMGNRIALVWFVTVYEVIIKVIKRLFSEEYIFFWAITVILENVGA